MGNRDARGFPSRCACLENLSEDIMKRIILLLAACLLVFAIPAAAEETAVETQFHWNMGVLLWETAESLAATEAITNYEGYVNTAVHEDAPADGCVYLLVKLSLQKTEAGGEGFQWEKLYALDAEGNRYLRMENDTFLETYGFKRLPATELRIGDQQGFIAFEVPAEKAEDAFTFWYALTEDAAIAIEPAAADEDE
jgi:hypothetical protein